jgi:hypothetical protein
LLTRTCARRTRLQKEAVFGVDPVPFFLPFAGDGQGRRSRPARAVTVPREAGPCDHRIDCDAGDGGGGGASSRGRKHAQAVTRGSHARQKNGRSDAALCRGLRLGQIGREFALLPCLTCVSSPRPSGPLVMYRSEILWRCVSCPRSWMRERRSGKATVERHWRSGRIEPKMRTDSVLALGRLISFGFRKKRQQADSSDAHLTSTPTTTISATGGRAFNLQSKSSA